MKKQNEHKISDLHSEYDFASMKGGVRGKYFLKYKRGTNLALLEPDLARVFPTDVAVNRALRKVAEDSMLPSPAKRHLAKPATHAKR
jgi:hypothetical protein